AAGQYAAQMLSADPTKKSTKHVIFQARRGDTPSFPLIDFGQEQQSIAGPKHVTIKGFAVGLLRAWAGADDVLWQNVDAGYFGIFDATNITLRGGDYGPCVAPRDGDCESFIAGRAANIVIDGIYLHDIRTADPVNYHVDGIFLRGSKNVAIRDSRFRGN